MQHQKLKNFIIPVISASLFLASCAGDTESLTALKAKQAELKTQLADISSN